MASSTIVAAPLVVPRHVFEICDAKSGLASIPAAETCRLVVTSPPYYGCRDYAAGAAGAGGNAIGASHAGKSGALGHEATPFGYAENLAAIFGGAAEAHYLARDGSLVVVLGDTFARKAFHDVTGRYPPIIEKSAIGINALFTFEMRRRGWRLWQEIVWQKPSVPPSGAARARCNPCHEYVLWFDRGLEARPRFDAHAIREPGKTPAGKVMPPVGGKKYGDYQKELVSDGMRCRQSVWSVCPSRDKSAHVAPFPEEIPELWILACTGAGERVCDPFAGTRTVERICARTGRACISFDLYDWRRENGGDSTDVAGTAESDDGGGSGGDDGGGGGGGGGSDSAPKRARVEA